MTKENNSNEKLITDKKTEHKRDLSHKQNEFVWRKATHEGECVKCQKRAERQNKKCEIRELNDRDICEEHDKRKKIIILILAIVGLGIILLLGLSMCNQWGDPNAKFGNFPGKTREQIEQDLNAQVRDGEMNVSIMNTIKFPNGTDDYGIANIENIEANHVDQKVILKLKDTGETLYESGAIAPGEYIDQIKINKHLDPGAYRAIATFIGYEHEGDFFNNHPQKGAPLAAEINLYVE